VTEPDLSVLDAAEFDALFDAFTTEVARLETLPAYAVGGAEQQRLAAFRGGHPRPLRSVRTDPWLARMAVSTVVAGKSWTRIRVVDDPMTDYQRYQLASYRESQAVGEQVRIAQRVAVGEVGTDFWLFDRRMVVLMHYDADGRVDRRELRDDRALVDRCRDQLDAVAALAVPLNDFLAVADE
jgi:hypothetical protein